MNRKFTLLLLSCILLINTQAQWSNTTNQFYDSLDMPVVQAANDQKNPLIIKSEPDGGYFVIWEDFRNTRSDGYLTSDIYAQKYDKDGKRLWAENGVPVATGDDYQRYSTISNNSFNYHKNSHAASDGAGGFYIVWSISNNSDVYVEHIKSNGRRVFADVGYPLAVHADGENVYYSEPQLIGDGNGGFFVGYLKQSGNIVDCIVNCYKEESGTLKSYGGGSMNGYQQLQQRTGQCGIFQDLVEGFHIGVKSFSIFPDGQGGCGVAMALETNVQNDFLAYNWLCRVKKDCHVIVDRSFDRSEIPNRGEFFYKKGTVARVYTLSLSTLLMKCSSNDPPKAYVYTSYFVDNYGFIELTPVVYDIENVNAALLNTDGNINAALITWNEQDYIDSKVTNLVTHGQALTMEIYDSLPYQLCTDTTHPYLGYNPVRPDDMDKLNEGKSDIDTLLAPSSNTQSYYYDYSVAGSGNRALLASSVNGLSGSSGPSPFYYQEAKVIRQTADSFAVKINTANKKGTVFGIGTGNDKLLNLVGDDAGNATFYYIGPNGRDHVNASPVGEGGKLLWGSLGIPLNSGGVSSRYYSPTSSFLYMDADGKAVVAWSDGRKTKDGYSGENVYMRHLDSLLNTNYQPPLLKPQLIADLTSTYYYGTQKYAASSDPQSLLGTSNAWSAFSVERVGIDYDALNLGGAPVTPVAQIKDDYDLGTVTVQVNENYNPAVRTMSNGHPYLGRNYTITVTNHPIGASIHVRLIFTKSEFDSLKAYDPTIRDPGDLAVIKQPNSSGTLSNDYTPVAGEKGIKPVAWAAIESTAEDGTVTIDGYYIEIVISDFSNFFIGSAATILPVSLQNFTAVALHSTSVLSWQTALEINNGKFEIERSSDAKTFTKIGSVAGHGTTSIAQDYSFTDNTPLAGNNYYRLAQVDLDGKINYSEMRMVTFGISKGALKVFPNPSKGIVHVQFPQASDGASAIELFSISGTKVLFQTISAGDTQTDIDISFLPKGIYILKYEKQSTKLVKE